MQQLADVSLAQPAPRWSVRDALIAFAVGVALYLLGSLVLARVAESYGTMGSPLMALLVVVPQLLLVLPALIVAARRGPLAAALGLNQVGWRGLLLVVPTLMVGFCGSLAWGLVLLAFDRQAQPLLVPLFGDSPLGLVALLLAGGLLAPLIEESLFRGFLFGALRERYTPWRAALVSALLFAGLHFQPFAFPVLFLYGLLLAGLYHASRSLWAPILMHAAINSLGIIAQWVVIRYGLMPM